MSGMNGLSPCTACGTTADDCDDLVVHDDEACCDDCRHVLGETASREDW